MEDLILIKLEIIRGRMIQSGLEKGLRNEETVKLSHEFDELMNYYESMPKSCALTSIQLQNNFNFKV